MEEAVEPVGELPPPLPEEESIEPVESPPLPEEESIEPEAELPPPLPEEEAVEPVGELPPPLPEEEAVDPVVGKLPPPLPEEEAVDPVAELPPPLPEEEAVEPVEEESSAVARGRIEEPTGVASAVAWRNAPGTKPSCHHLLPHHRPHRPSKYCGVLSVSLGKRRSP